jgi:hypothetical protein
MKVDVAATEIFLKEKALYKEVSNNDAMFRHANSLVEVAQHLYSTSVKSHDTKEPKFALR